MISGVMRDVASVQGPYSEGHINPGYANVVFAMFKDMVGREPLLYDWGFEGGKSPILTLFRALGWISHSTPIVHWNSDFAEPAAGPAGICTTRVASFAPWADEVWASAAAAYDFVVARDAASLDRLYPPENERFHRLMIRANGEVAGWALVGVKRFEQDANFGNARIAVLWDFFAQPPNAGAVIEGARDYVASIGADSLLASVCHREWINAFVERGFKVISDQRKVLVSRPLAAALAPFAERASQCFLTFGDGESYHGSPRLGQPLFESD
jgi:hypothetical protein